ncbi:MAG: hypothetical protein OXD54_07060 [Candidatus Poribacteria bacterium]|nr:hypothetical protein [Candidatus Poribacteria bacterium]
MFSIAEIFYLVFSQLAVGGFAVMLFIPKGVVGANYYRLMGGIYLLVVVLARCANLYLNETQVTVFNFFGSWVNVESALVLCFVLIVFIYTLSWWFKSSLLTDVLFYLGMIIGIVWILFSAFNYIEVVQFPGVKYLLTLQFLTSAVLLGAVHTGMWFGHWYLVIPELPVAYLRRYNIVLLCSLVLSISLFGVNMLIRSQAQNTVSFNFHYELIFWMRLGIGYAGTLILYFISWDCLRPKSVAKDEVGATRAATGFLFIAIITVFLGEFCSRYLFLSMQFVF